MIEERRNVGSGGTSLTLPQRRRGGKTENNEEGNGEQSLLTRLISEKKEGEGRTKQGCLRKFLRTVLIGLWASSLHFPNYRARGIFFPFSVRQAKNFPHKDVCTRDCTDPRSSVSDPGWLFNWDSLQSTNALGRIVGNSFIWETGWRQDGDSWPQVIFVLLPSFTANENTDSYHRRMCVQCT